LDPRRHTYDDTDIPLLGLFSNFIQLGIPVPVLGDLLSRLIKMLKPER
jgi:hypothetical protein